MPADGRAAALETVADGLEAAGAELVPVARREASLGTFSPTLRMNCCKGAPALWRSSG